MNGICKFLVLLARVAFEVAATRLCLPRGIVFVLLTQKN